MIAFHQSSLEAVLMACHLSTTDDNATKDHSRIFLLVVNVSRYFFSCFWAQGFMLLIQVVDLTFLHKADPDGKC